MWLSPCLFSQFIHNPGPVHWEALKHVIIYLGSMKDLWLTFGSQSKILAKGYCNTNWGGQKHHHSISGYSFHIGGGTISWSSRKQHLVTLSSTEAEYIAQTHAVKKGQSQCLKTTNSMCEPNTLTFATTLSIPLVKMKFCHFIKLLGL